MTAIKGNAIFVTSAIDKNGIEWRQLDEGLCTDYR